MHKQVKEELRSLMVKYQTHPEFLGSVIASCEERSVLDNTLLHLAASAGDLKDITLLIEEGADVNAKGDLGYTPLHVASLMDQGAAVKLLLELGANPAIRNKYGQTAKELANSAALGGE